MKDNIVQFPEEKSPDFMMGPMKSWPVIIEGRRIPRLEAWIEGENTFICIDNRISISVPNAQAYNVCYIAATALAIGAGYSNIHAETADRCFAPKCAQITTQP